MKKKHVTKKILLIMRLSILLMFICLISIEAKVNSQLFTFDVKGTTVKDVLADIESNSTYKFLYRTDIVDVSSQIDLKIKDADVKAVLSRIFNTEDITFRIFEDNLVVITNAGKLQTQKVTGSVTDALTGEPLMGVNIQVEGTLQGTITDSEGNYSIQVPGGETVLIFSYIGYITERVIVEAQTVIDVKLAPNVQELEEVVVVGYGTVRKSDLTGAISTVKPAELTQLPTQRVDQALQGRTSGVLILNTDGAPGGSTMIRIRGLNSINGGNEPLIVIDGLQGGNINSINPNDIASIEILKDASATAIYGSRGSNGVVLITTKLGQQGKPVVDASYSVGFQNLAHKLPVIGAADFCRFMNKYRSVQTQQGGNSTPLFTDAEIAYYEKNGGTDWQNVIFETGQIHNGNLAISGATDKLKYMVSGNYLNHQGILVNSKYDRASLRANLSADVSKWLDFGLNYAYTKETYKSPSFRDEISWTSQAIHNAARWAPTEPVYDDEGNYWTHRPNYGGQTLWNPLACAKEPIIHNPTYRNNANLSLNFKPLPGLSLRITGGLIFTNQYYRDYYNTKVQAGLENNGYGNARESVYEHYQNSNILTYDKSFGSHHITFTGVVEQIFEEGKGHNVEGKDFLVDQLGIDNLGGASMLKSSSWHNKRTLLSYMGRINYVLKDRYMATFSYRADGSSVFGKDNKWGYFPSGSLAWRISEEGFLKDVAFINDLKLRASYGVTGNQGINPYESLASLGSGYWWSYPWKGQNATNIGFGISGIANPELKWESTKQTDIGLDLSLFKGRLTSTIDVYKKVTEDLLMPRELPGYVGVSSVLANVGSIQNQGLEIIIGGDPIVRPFRWNTSVNFTMNRNKVLDLGPDDRIGYGASTGGYSTNGEFMYLEVGEPYGAMNGWKWLGIWSTDEEAEARSYGQLPGDSKFWDKDNDGDVDSDDRTTIGNGYPKYTWGWTNLLNYKNIELSFLIIGSHGNDMFNTLRILRETYYCGNDPSMLDYWTPENQDTRMPGLIDGKYREDQHLVSKYYFGASNSNLNSRWVEDASFIRLKTLTLAYTFDQSLMKKIGFQKARLYVSGTNLWTKTDYKGYDPESAAFSNWGDVRVGVDYSVYPAAKTYTIGVDFTF
jgi:TonB-linked SusC/RagA family outer membrane protein